MGVIHRDCCRLCSSRRVELAVPLAPVPLAEKYSNSPTPSDADVRYPIDLYLCRDCGHVQLLDVIDADRLWDDYTYRSGQTKGIVEHFEHVADEVIRKYQPPPGSLIVDVGSNDGSLLRPFANRGYRVLGIDPARDIARQATESGIETLPELMTESLAKKIRHEFGPASVVTAFNVFAHADDMNGMAASIRTMLDPAGVFLFEAQYLMDIVDHLLLGTVFHEHMSHHSLRPLKTFLERHGMELFDVERVSIQKGSIIGSSQHLHGPRPIQSSVSDLLALEAEHKLDSMETMRRFSERLHEQEVRIAGLMDDWTRRKAKVAAFGAARSGPTYIEQFRLGRVLEYILDDHPQKVGKYSPGDHLPVVPTRELYERKPDFVVILAWIHAKKIIASHRRFLEEGGKFVTVCPEVQVIDVHSPPPPF